VWIQLSIVRPVSEAQLLPVGQRHRSWRREAPGRSADAAFGDTVELIEFGCVPTPPVA